MNDQQRQSLGRHLLLLLLMPTMFLFGKALSTPTEKSVPYSEFEQRLKAGQFTAISIGDRDIVGILKHPDPQAPERISSVLVEPSIVERFSVFGIPYERTHEAAWSRDLRSWLLPLMFFVALWLVTARYVRAYLPRTGWMGAGQRKARTYMEQSTGVCFDDVASADEAEAELEEVVDFLKNPKVYGRLGARVPKGILLMGPAGTGKTLLARAVAGEARVPLFSINGSEVIEMFVGVGAARVRDLFEQARQHAPAIIFIDELDAIGQARGVGSISRGLEEREQTLNQLLLEMDGFDPRAGVVLMAATSRPEILDAALLRAGRFDHQVRVDRPDRSGRLAILRVHVRKIHMADHVDLEQIAAITVGLAGADLVDLVNEAALAAIRRQGMEVTQTDFTQALERITTCSQPANGATHRRGGA